MSRQERILDSLALSLENFLDGRCHTRIYSWRSFRHLISSWYWFGDRTIHDPASLPCLVQENSGDGFVQTPPRFLRFLGVAHLFDYTKAQCSWTISSCLEFQEIWLYGWLCGGGEFHGGACQSLRSQKKYSFLTSQDAEQWGKCYLI